MVEVRKGSGSKARKIAEAEIQHLDEEAVGKVDQKLTKMFKLHNIVLRKK